MKTIRSKIIGLLLVFMLFSYYTPMAFAVDAISFRDFEWFDNYQLVKSTCDQIDGIKAPWLFQTEEKATISSWDHEFDILDSNAYVSEGGVKLSYSEIPVAGYTAELDLSFLYPIIEGKLQYDLNSAQLVKAEYTIKDIIDVEGTFYDLESKLSSLYGTPVDKSYTNSLFNYTDPKGLLWTANDGSLVWLTMDYNIIDEKYYQVGITYAAPGLNAAVIKQINQIEKEASDIEEATRKHNSSNTGGL